MHYIPLALPFFTTMPKGTGLGLAITQRVIEEHLGKIQVVSELGSGTRVTLDFPAPPGQEIKIWPTMSKV